MKKCLFHIEQLCLSTKGGDDSLLYSFTVFRSDSMCRTLDYNWFYTEWREECVTVMNNFCYMMCKAALTGPRKCSPTSLGVFFQNIFEKKKRLKLSKRSFTDWREVWGLRRRIVSRRVWIMYWIVHQCKGIQSNEHTRSLFFKKLGMLYPDLKSFLEPLEIFTKESNLSVWVVDDSVGVGVRAI